MPIKHLIRFVVEGSHEFPFDMLRYDAAFPASQDDIAGLSPYPRSEIYKSKRQVALKTIKATGPTILRWESFGWKVIEVGSKQAV